MQRGISAAGNADEEDAARGFQPLLTQERTLFRCEEETLLIEPVAQARKPANILHTIVNGDLLKP